MGCIKIESGFWDDVVNRECEIVSELERALATHRQVLAQARLLCAYCTDSDIKPTMSRVKPTIVKPVAANPNANSTNRERVLAIVNAPAYQPVTKSGIAKHLGYDHLANCSKLISDMIDKGEIRMNEGLIYPADTTVPVARVEPAPDAPDNEAPAVAPPPVGTMPEFVAVNNPTTAEPIIVTSPREQVLTVLREIKQIDEFDIGIINDETGLGYDAIKPVMTELATEGVVNDLGDALYRVNRSRL